MTIRRRRPLKLKELIIPIVLGVLFYTILSWLFILPNGTKQPIKEAPRLETRVTEVQVTEAARIVKVVEKVEEETEFKFPFPVENLSVESLKDVDIGIVIDCNPYDVFLDCAEFYTAVDDAFTHTLNLYRERPDLRNEFIALGRYITINNLSYAIAPSGAGFREVQDFDRKNREMADAFRVIYSAFKWDGWIGPFRGCWGSTFHGAGLDYCEYLFRRGRSWENCLATLEGESTFGLGGTCYYGMLGGTGHPNTLQGYCDYLDENGVSNDPWEQACFWNMPGYPKYQEGFSRIANTLKNWCP